MKVGILGSTDVVKFFAAGFLKEGHQVMLGLRDPGKLASWVQESGDRSSSGTLSETARFGEVVVIAVNGAAAVNAVQMADPIISRGKLSSTLRIPWICRAAFHRS